MATKVELELMEVLMKTGLLQPMQTEGKGRTVSALCRMLPGQDKAWARAVKKSLLAFRDTVYKLHICRKYILKEDNIVAAQHISIDAGNAKGVQDAMKILREALADVEPDPLPVVATPAQRQQQGVQVPRRPIRQSEVLDPQFAADLEVRRARAEAGTSAAPRPPGMYTPDPIPPDNFNYEPRVVATGQMKDRRGNLVPVEVEEVPLPHVYTTHDMNAPRPGSLRGAKTVMGE